MQTKFKKFNKIPLFISLGFFLLSLGAFIFLYKNIRTNNQISEQAATESQAEASKREEIKSLDRSLKATAEEQALLDTHFVKSSDVVPLLDSIEKLAPQVKAKAEVTLVDISSDNSSLSIGVNVDGTFESIYKFLTLLENSNYQLEIVSMDVQKISDGTTVADTAKPNDTASGDSSAVAGTGTSPVTIPVVVAPVSPKVSKLPGWSAVFKIKLLSFLKS